MKNFIRWFKDLWNGTDMPGPSSKGVVYEEPKPYVPRYGQRTAFEHTGIRSVLKVDPKNCNHLKGGQFQKFDTSVVPRINSVGLDYNVSLHTFIDGSKRIRCLTCGKCWYQRTSPDWKEAVAMTQQSTNFPSSSEQVQFRVTYRGKHRLYSTTEEIKKDFPNWDGKLGSYKDYARHPEWEKYEEVIVIFQDKIQ